MADQGSGDKEGGSVPLRDLLNERARQVLMCSHSWSMDEQIAHSLETIVIITHRLQLTREQLVKLYAQNTPVGDTGKGCHG